MISVHPLDQFPAGLESPDVYFTPGYGRAISVSEGGEWLLLGAFDGAWQVPLIQRTLPDGTKDVITPHFSGVYASPSLSSAQIEEAWSATLTCLRDLGAISLVVRHSPLVPQAFHLPEQRSITSGFPTVVLEPADSDSAWSDMSGSSRTRVRKSLKSGYTGHVRQASHQDLAPDGDFRRLYEGTMGRLDAASVYFFGDAYYRELVDGLGPNLLIAEVQNEEGVPVSSSLLMRHGHRLHYHLSGSHPVESRIGTNNLMLWTATEFSIEQGLRQFHLGSGHGGERDDLFMFKRRFGGRELEYGVSGLTIDHELYRAHVAKRAKECGTTSEALLASNYFPAYRGGTLPSE